MTISLVASSIFCDFKSDFPKTPVQKPKTIPIDEIVAGSHWAPHPPNNQIINVKIIPKLSTPPFQM